MEVIENKQINEKVCIETLENGMKVILIPKKNTEKISGSATKPALIINDINRTFNLIVSSIDSSKEIE
mgnify:CR=1 FL=1